MKLTLQRLSSKTLFQIRALLVLLFVTLTRTKLTPFVPQLVPYSEAITVRPPRINQREPSAPTTSIYFLNRSLKRPNLCVSLHYPIFESFPGRDRSSTFCRCLLVLLRRKPCQLLEVSEQPVTPDNSLVRLIYRLHEVFHYPLTAFDAKRLSCWSAPKLPLSGSPRYPRLVPQKSTSDSHPPDPSVTCQYPSSTTGGLLQNALQILTSKFASCERQLVCRVS